MGCGRSVHGLAAIAKAADVLVDFTHDMQLHPLADMAALGTHEQTVLYQTAKLSTFPAHDTEDLMFKEKLPVGGILHVRGHSYIFHTLVFLRVLRWRCGWGSPALHSVLLGGGKKMCRMLSPAHGYSYQENSSSTFFPDNRTSRLSYLSYRLLNSS